MRIWPRWKRPQFSIRAVLVAMLLLSLYLGSVRYIQSAREQYRRGQCHNDYMGISIYDLHRATCPPCRRKMATNLSDETIATATRVAWLRELVDNAPDDPLVRRAIRKAARDVNSSLHQEAGRALRVIRGDPELAGRRTSATMNVRERVTATR